MGGAGTVNLNLYIRSGPRDDIAPARLRAGARLVDASAFCLVPALLFGCAAEVGLVTDGTTHGSTGSVAGSSGSPGSGNGPASGSAGQGGAPASSGATGAGGAVGTGGMGGARVDGSAGSAGLRDG